MLKTENYCISKENLPGHELIGLAIKISKSFDENKTKLAGKIIDETKNIIEIETKNGVKKVAKNEVEIEFDLNGEKVLIPGKILIGKPEDRVKLFWRKYHGKYK